MRFRIATMTLAILAGAASAQQPTSAPSVPSGDAINAQSAQIQTIIRRQVLSLIQVFRSDHYRSRQAAEQALTDLNKAYLESLLAQADDPDPEVRARVLEALTQAVAEARIARTLAKLPKDQREKLVRFRQAQPQVFADVFSLSWDQASKAMKKLGELKDPESLAEPLVVMSIQHPSPEVVSAALKAAGKGVYRSDAMVDALTDLLLRTRQDIWQENYYRRDDEGAPPHIAAMEALQVIKSRRAAPRLLALMLQNPNSGGRQAMNLLDALADTGEVRAIPHLMERLKLTNIQSTWSTGEKGKITMAPSDPAMLVLLKLTGQDPHSYKFMFWNEGGMGNVFGFAEEKDRTEAIAKFKTWWNQHKSEEPYRDLKPLEIPKLQEQKPEEDQGE